MDLHMKNRVVIVTGGASGIGAKTAEDFVREGAKVLIVDIHQEGIEKTVASLLQGMGGDAGGYVSK